MKNLGLVLPFLVLFLVLLEGCANSDISVSDDSVTAHIESSIIGFSNADSSPVDTYLSEYQVINLGEPVQATNLQTGVLSANAYTPVSGLQPGTMANYSISGPIPVDATEVSYSLTVNNLLLDPLLLTGTFLPPGFPWSPFENVHSGPAYGFGTGDESASAAHVCELPPPDGEPPTTSENCPIVECAAVLDVHIAAIGDTTALAGVDTVQPAFCGVRARVEEVSGSGTFVDQAFSGVRLVDTADLLAEGVDLPILIRAMDNKVAVDAACVVQTTQDGYANPTDLPEGWTPVASDISVLIDTPVSCDVSDASVDIDVVVERDAGTLRGLFDVVGHDEMSPTISTDQLGVSYVATPPTAAATELLDPTDDEDYWEIPDIPTGTYTLFGETLLDGGKRFLRTPSSVFNNGGPFTPPADTGALFIAKPYKVAGEVIIDDPVGGAFSILSLDMNVLDSSTWTGQSSRSYMSAAGVEQLSGEPNAGSGDNGIARALLQLPEGTPQLTLPVSTLEYEFAFTGLSQMLTGGDGFPAGADGLLARPTLWDIVSARLTFGESTAPPFEWIDIRPTAPLEPEAIYTHPGDEAPAMPPMRMCMGHADLDFRMGTSEGFISKVYVTLDPSYVSAMTTIQPAHYIGVTGGYLEGTLTATGSYLSAILPEGIQYKGDAVVTINYPNDSTATRYFNNLLFPDNHALACGEHDERCLTLVPGDDGTEIPVSTTITAPEAICLDEGVATLPIEVDGNGVGIDSVSIKFDGITEVLCDVDCGEVFTQVANLNIPEGITGLTIEVVNNAGCSDDIPVVISDTEVDLSCPENKAVLLNPDEEFLAHTDPRIAGHLDTYMVSGGCPVASVSYLPTFYSLSESPETITFSAGGESCTMELSLRRDQIAFIENETVKLHTLGGSEAWSRNFDLPVALDFDRAGNLLVVGQHIVGDSVTVLNADTGNTLSSFTGQEIIDLQVRPVEPLAIAIVEQSGEPGMPFRVRILSEEGDLGEMQFRYYPHIDWSNGGSLLLITSIDDPLGAGGVLGATVRHQLGQEQADGQYQFTMLTPDDRIDENVILDAAFIAHNNQGANIGFATTGGLFRRSGIGETVELPTDLINLAVADFRHEEPSMMGARSGSGQLDIISDADIPAIDIGAHGIAVSNWAPDRKIAVMKPLSIDIYDLSASSTPVPHGFIVPLVDSNGDQITVTTTARARSVVFRPYP